MGRRKKALSGNALKILRWSEGGLMLGNQSSRRTMVLQIVVAAWCKASRKPQWEDSKPSVEGVSTITYNLPIWIGNM